MVTHRLRLQLEPVRNLWQRKPEQQRNRSGSGRPRRRLNHVRNERQLPRRRRYHRNPTLNLDAHLVQTNLRRNRKSKHRLNSSELDVQSKFVVGWLQSMARVQLYVCLACGTVRVDWHEPDEASQRINPPPNTFTIVGSGHLCDWFEVGQVNFTKPPRPLVGEKPPPIIESPSPPVTRLSRGPIKRSTH